MRMLLSLTMVGLGLLSVGCEPSQVASETKGGTDAPSSQFVLETEPDGALAVGEARKATQDGQDVTLVGLIGGSSEPFVDGMAAFTIVDSKVPYCAADEGCPTPWDYCCESDAVKDNIATIKIVDESGSPVAADARELLNVKELSTIVVKGKAKRDDQGNLTVASSEVFVRQN
ncbi:MAG: hypothetical protein KDA72_16970 [Planctomycetales bacterium]|nr:hypothetical protein [Planctomycetales bacterium]